MEEIRNLLGSELKSEIENLSKLTPGTEEHSDAVESVKKLYSLRIEDLKAEWEYSERFDRREMDEAHLKREDELKEKQFKSDEEFKKKQIDEMRYERYFKYGVEVALAIAGWVFFNHQTNKGYRFEQTGTILSQTFKNVLRGVKLRR